MVSDIDWKKVIAFTVSILIHLFVIVFVATPQVGGESVEEQINTEPDPVQVRLLPKEEKTAAEKTEADKGAPTEMSITDLVCTDEKSTYKGIGIIWWPDTGQVLEAPEFNPAYKAGIRVGDFIINDVTQVDGYVDIIVLRNYNKLTFRIKTENICFDEK